MLQQYARPGVKGRLASFARLPSSAIKRPALPDRTTSLDRRLFLTRHQPAIWKQSRYAARDQPTDRGLATAVDDYRFDHMSYNQLSNSSMAPFHPAGMLNQASTSFDPSIPLNIPEPQERLAFSRMNKHGIIADVDDIFPVFDALVRVGKLDRALMVLRRFAKVQYLAPEEQILLHNKYLNASLEQVRTNSNLAQAEQLHKYYELNIRDKLPHTAETIACMLKASLLSERGSRLERLVRRYMSIVPGEAGLQVLSMAEILNDQDLAVITDICPQYNLASEQLDWDEGNTADESDKLATSSEAFDLWASQDMPELIPTEQKGGSLETLKRTFSPIAKMEHVDVSNLPLEEQQEMQRALERETITATIDQWRADLENMRSMGLNPRLGGEHKGGLLKQSLGTWLETLEATIKNEHKLINESENRAVKTGTDLRRCNYGPIVQQCDPARLAAVTILSVLNSLGSDVGAKGVPSTTLAFKIAKNIQDDFRMQLKQQREKEARLMKRRAARRVTLAPGTTETASATALPETEPKKKVKALGPQQYLESYSSTNRVNFRAEGPEDWSPSLNAHVGAFLLKCLVDTAKIRTFRKHPASQEVLSQLQPAFAHTTQPRKGRKVALIHMNSYLSETLQKEPVGDYLAKHLPMVAPPMPWRDQDTGGFLESKSRLVRVKNGDEESALYAKAAIKSGDMDQVFEGLDVLGRTPWRINNDILRVMTDAWNRGEAIANMPPAQFQPEIPAEPDSSSDPMARRRWVLELKKIENDRMGLHSQRCHWNLQLEVARMFRNQKIYFPHNVDYRGRAYPMPTYLNHMGADHARSLLKFADGKPLGEAGLRWLKIHFANVYGLDKASFQDREAFATDNLDKIIECANNPLDGSKWWLNAEDPWQCLATCFELKAAHEMQDPTKYVCNLPVHQDGTCNGLQHYAALGGDTWGAAQVNLVPGEKPADVYSAVADLVREGIRKDAEEDNPFAKVMKDKIIRKVVKQTVMTNVYGVTFQGAKKQVCKQIDDHYPNLSDECGIPHIMLATYVARHIFTALATMFSGAHDIQYWLGEMGGRVTRALTATQLEQLESSQGIKAFKSKNGQISKQKEGAALKELTSQFRSTVVWTTPLRMPVAQPYRKSSARRVDTALQSIAIEHTDQTSTVHRRKQLQGFPPNFIHSLDASHMLLSATQCDKLGLRFAAVHDSFWTHAADIDVMNDVLRNAFVDIHQEDVIGRLAAEFTARHQGSMYMAKLAANSAAAGKIRELRKQLGQTAVEELLMERERMMLLQSENPDEVAKGRAMVTPGSIFSEHENTDVADEADIKETMLGGGPDASMSLDKQVEELAKKQPLDEALVEPEEEKEEEEENEEEDGEAPKAEFGKMSSSHFEQELLGRNRKTYAQTQQTIPVWLPLTVPPIPKKGDFDVSQLKDSQYFFS